MLAPTSEPLPPRKVEYTSGALPVALNLVTKASLLPPPKVGWKADAVVGKLED